MGKVAHCRRYVTTRHNHEGLPLGHQSGPHHHGLFGLRHWRAAMFAQYFSSVYRPVHAAENVNPPTDINNGMDLQRCEPSWVKMKLLKIPATKASGPDDIPVPLLHGLVDVVAPALANLINLSISKGTVPTLWKSANITPVPKVSRASCVSLFRPISLTSILSKICEKWEKLTIAIPLCAVLRNYILKLFKGYKMTLLGWCF